MINQIPSVEDASMIQNVVSRSCNMERQPVLALVLKLCESLEAERIDYCHWKSNEALPRSASGENDLDLLVSRAHAEKFAQILFRLGFREVQKDGDGSLPGVLNYYGYDADTDRLVHAHVHYQLVLGNDLSKNYRIPIEQPYLHSATHTGIFRVPAPEYELVIFVIRMVLKHSTWDSILLQQGRLSTSERRELEYLATPENLRRAGTVLQEHLPYLDETLFDACLETLQPGCALAKRIRIGEELQGVLKACARYPEAMDILFKFSRRLWLSVQQRILRRKSKRHPANGGLLVAIVGGDGSGKTTAIDGLIRQLAPALDIMKLHMGKPTWSTATTAIRGLLKLGTMLGLYARGEYQYGGELRFPGYPWLIRRVCTARDRYLTYLKARRFSSNGGLVICDRYSLPSLGMDAPQCEWAASILNRSNWFLQWLREKEEGYYRRIDRPDLMIVLRVDPEIAVQRKTDESARSVRTRSALVWEFDWSKTPAHVLDAGLSKSEVLAQIRSLVWEHL